MKPSLPWAKRQVLAVRKLGLNQPPREIGTWQISNENSKLLKSDLASNSLRLPPAVPPMVKKPRLRPPEAPHFWVLCFE